jgi:hypothetical protein
MTHRLFYASSVAVTIAAAIAFAASSAVHAQSAAKPAAASTSMPRLSNGKPDLSGIWGNAHPIDFYHMPVEGSVHNLTNRVAVDAKNFKGAGENVFGNVLNTRRCAPSQHEVRKAQGRDQCDEGTNEYIDSELTTRMDPNRPLYKPEYWTKVQELDYDANNQDPQMICQSRGVPRLGPPAKIVQSPKEVIFFYGGGEDFRIIPTDGRGHNPKADPTLRGDSVGHWEGDTLVVDVTSFNDRSWLSGGLAGDGGGGYFHSYEMHVIERFTRRGDSMLYEVTVDDPEVFLEPWKKNPMELKLNSDPKATILEPTPCNMEYDKSTIVGRNRH